MDKNIIKIVGLLVGLVALVTVILIVAINGINLENFNIVSLSGISDRRENVEKLKENLEIVEMQYDTNLKSLETAKKEFAEQKEAYELISNETISTIKEATKEEEYFIEYLWITLGNYAAVHDLALAIIEPGGTLSQVAQEPSTTENNDATNISTGTGITGNSNGVTSTTNAATTGLPTSGTGSGDESQTESVTSDLTSSENDLTVQVKGSYMDLADFVFEVENDRSLRFRLDNIKMRSAGGTEVLASFTVKDFTVLKSLE